MEIEALKTAGLATRHIITETLTSETSEIGVTTENDLGKFITQGTKDKGMEDLLQSAAHVSNSLTDAMEFVPRVVEGASGVFSLHPKEDAPITMKHPPLRLRYKGKASKKQLERLRKRVQLHAREG